MVNHINLEDKKGFKVLTKQVRFCTDQNCIYLTKEQFERCYSFYSQMKLED